VAEKSLFINIARIMWAFDIQIPPGKESEWKVFVPEKGGFNIPKEEPVIIQPRSLKHAQVLRQEWEESRKAGLHYHPAPRAVFSTKNKD
jgi:hypothetical protein